uniref:Uncharacterized protein n=1 Tax=Sciurus vulgaris TaxID=55149 RepID=A0A8D2DB12_SCIVU
MSASDTPKSRFDTSSFPPVSTPAPPPKPLSNRSKSAKRNRPVTPRAMPALPRPRPPPRPPRWLRFSLMMSSRDMSILSAMAGAESGLSSSPRVSTPARHFRRPAQPSGDATPERPGIGRGARGAGGRVRTGSGARRAQLWRRRPRCGRFYTFPRGRRRRQRKGGAARD